MKSTVGLVIDWPELSWLIRPKLRPGVCEVIKYELLDFALTSPKENASIFIETCNCVDFLVALLECLGAVNSQSFTVVENKHELYRTPLQTSHNHCFLINTLVAKLRPPIFALDFMDAGDGLGHFELATLIFLAIPNFQRLIKA